MNAQAVMIVAVASLLAVAPSSGSQAPADSAGASPTAKPDQTGGDPAVSAQNAAREERFEDMLTGATLTGTWQVTEKQADSDRVSLGPPKSDTYMIASVAKQGGNVWVISARIQYADQDITLPVPVRVLWAGDTPVITMDGLTLPGMGTYSARVMFHGGFYCGTWFCEGRNAGGVMSGQITRTADTTAESAPAAPK